MVAYEKVKRLKEGKCNICGEMRRLSWDHVPPKSCFNGELVRYNKLYSDIGAQDTNSQSFEMSQNGVKFRTICGNCNNLLGAQYDSELKYLVDEVHKIIISELDLPRYINIQVNLNKVSRSIAGHLLAARKEYVGNENKIDAGLRKLLLNKEELPPDDLSLFLFVYPYNNIMIIRDITVKNVLKPAHLLPEGVISCFYFYPLAFILASQQTYSNMSDIFLSCSKNIDEIIDLKIDLLSWIMHSQDKFKHPHWPCYISDDDGGTDMVLMGNSVESSVVTQGRKINFNL